MARIINTMGFIGKSLEYIDHKYDMNTKNADDIIQESQTPLDMVYSGFLFGYAQGVKATKAEIQKGGITV